MSGQLRRNWFKVSLTGGLYLFVFVVSLQSSTSTFINQHLHVGHKRYPFSHQLR